MVVCTQADTGSCLAQSGFRAWDDASVRLLRGACGSAMVRHGSNRSPDSAIGKGHHLAPTSCFLWRLGELLLPKSRSTMIGLC